MRTLTQHLSALIVVGLCVAALFGAGAGLGGLVRETLRGDAGPASTLELAASVATRLEALRASIPIDRAGLR